MPRTSFPIVCSLALTLLFIANVPAQQESLVPDEPIKQFRLPGFDDAGDRAWVLEGDQARVISAEEIEVTAMVLRTFAKGDPRNAQTIIQSPLALIYPNQSLAWGNGIITINDRYDAYSIVGEDWLWRGDDQKVTINKDARVTFTESLGPILE